MLQLPLRAPTALILMSFSVIKPPSEEWQLLAGGRQLLQLVHLLRYVRFQAENRPHVR